MLATIHSQYIDKGQGQRSGTKVRDKGQAQSSGTNVWDKGQRQIHQMQITRKNKSKCSMSNLSEI